MRAFTLRIPDAPALGPDRNFETSTKVITLVAEVAAYQRVSRKELYKPETFSLWRALNDAVGLVVKIKRKGPRQMAEIHARPSILRVPSV